MTPLEKSFFKAVKTGDLDAVQKLLAESPELAGSRDAEAATPLHWAAWKNQVGIAKALLAAGAEVNAISENSHWGTTPLHAAAHGNQRAVAEVLLNAGADLKIENLNGKTPLMETSVHRATAVQKLIRDRDGA